MLWKRQPVPSRATGIWVQPYLNRLLTNGKKAQVATKGNRSFTKQHTMATILVALIVVASIIAIFIILVKMSKKQEKKRLAKMRHHFSQLGSEHHLSFTSQEVLRDRMIGFDGLNRKLLILEETKDHYAENIIDLTEVKNCSVKKAYSNVMAGSVPQRNMDDFLQQIALEFVLKNNTVVEFPFYKNTAHSIYEIKELEAKAKHWESMLSKLILKRLERA